MDDWKALSLDELVDFFKREGISLRADEREELRKLVKEKTLVYIYSMPDRYAGLGREDAATILLSMTGSIDSALDSFKPGEMPFSAYIRRLAKKKAKAIVRSDRNERKKEQAILTLHSYWENPEWTEGSDLENEERPEEDWLVIKRIRYLLDMSHFTRRRFFIYLCRFMPFMSMDVVHRICESFDFDFIQTRNICDIIWIRFQKENGYQDRLETARNIHWQHQTAVEQTIADLLYFDDRQGAERMRKREEFHHERLMKSNERLSRIPSGVASSVLVGKVLGMSDSAVNSACYHSRRLLDFCCDRIPLENWREIAKTHMDERDYIYMRSGFWDGEDSVAEPPCMYAVQTFKPYKEFGIDHVGKDGYPRRSKR